MFVFFDFISDSSFPSGLLIFCGIYLGMFRHVIIRTNLVNPREFELSGLPCICLFYKNVWLVFAIQTGLLMLSRFRTRVFVAAMMAF